MNRALRQDDPEARPLLEHVPDVPRWVEARGMLLSGRGRVAARGPSPADALLVADDEHLAVVVGHPDARALADATGRLETVSTLVLPAEHRDLLPLLHRVLGGWAEEEAVLHELVDARLPTVRASRDADVRWLADPAACSLDHLPADLVEELPRAAEVSPIAAAFEDGLPVAFCYAAWQTETLWDVSIDTAPGSRRRGHGAAAAGFLIEAFARAGKRPVWGAMAGNIASRGLARRLGFTPVDVLRVFERVR
jgi:RimJ/RimL family protein N-acetyltransferase